MSSTWEMLIYLSSEKKVYPIKHTNVDYLRIAEGNLHLKFLGLEYCITDMSKLARKR